VKKQILRAAVDVHTHGEMPQRHFRQPLSETGPSDISPSLMNWPVGWKAVSSTPPLRGSWICGIRPTHAWLVEGKMANLGEILNVVGLPTAPRVPVTAEAYSEHHSPLTGFLPVRYG